MNTTLSALDHVQSTFATLTTPPHSIFFDSSTVPLLDSGDIPIPQLSKILLHHDTTSQTKDAVWRRLVHLARTDKPEWVVIASGLALPGLRRAAARVAHIYPHADVTEGQSEVLAGFLHALRQLDTTRTSICSKLCQAAFSAGRTYARRQIAASRAIQELARTPHIPARGHVDLVLADAVENGTITQIGATIIAATRLDKTPLTTVAEHLGISTYQARKIAKTAAQQLIAELGN